KVDHTRNAEAKIEPRRDQGVDETTQQSAHDTDLQECKNHVPCPEKTKKPERMPERPGMHAEKMASAAHTLGPFWHRPYRLGRRELGRIDDALLLVENLHDQRLGAQIIPLLAELDAIAHDERVAADF